MKKVLGPILYVGQSTEEQWRFYVALLFDGDDVRRPPVEVSASDGATVGSAEVAADLRAIGRGVYWRWRIDVRRADTERRVSYIVQPRHGQRIEGLPGPLRVDDIAVPARNGLPRLAFFACNGFSDPKVARKVARPYELWDALLQRHMQARGTPDPDIPEGFHLMVGGGDQIYADSLWHTHPMLSPYKDASRQERVDARPAAEFDRHMQQAYVDLYVERWAVRSLADAFAHIPGIFTWDDHDIFDGWGSYDAELQRCPLYRGVFAGAETAFRVFQLGGLTKPLHTVGTSHFLQAVQFRGTQRVLDLLLLDLRSERSLDQVMSPAQWRDLKTWLAAHAAEGRSRRHLLVVSSIPLVYMRFSALVEKVGTWASLDDDLHDQWESDGHRGERAALLMNLLAHAQKADCRITLISGDVHLGSRGRITSREPGHIRRGEPEATIEQVTASGIVHPPPSALELLGMQAIAAETEIELSPLARTELLGVGGSDYLRDRSWISVGFDQAGAGQNAPVRLWAQWWTAAGRVPEQVVVGT
jgi:hypothetical protein